VSDEPRICLTCKHFSNERTLSTMQAELSGQVTPGPLCGHALAHTRDPVFGRAMCRDERFSSSRKACGPTGRLWEKR